MIAHNHMGYEGYIEQIAEGRFAASFDGHPIGERFPTLDAARFAIEDYIEHLLTIGALGPDAPLGPIEAEDLAKAQRVALFRQIQRREQSQPDSRRRTRRDRRKSTGEVATQGHYRHRRLAVV